MQSNAIKLAIVDDHTLFRKALKNYLFEHGNIQVVIQSHDIPDLLNKLKTTPVHLLLMHIFLPQLNECEAIKAIKHEYPDIKILVLSMSTDMDLLSELLELGVFGILTQADEPDELIHAITSLSNGKIYRSRLLTEVMYWNRQYDNNKTTDIITSLSEREKQVLQLLWEEKSNKEIARQIFLGTRSVEKIRQDMKKKLGVKSTIGLFKYAITNKMIKINVPSFADLMPDHQ